MNQILMSARTTSAGAVALTYRGRTSASATKVIVWRTTAVSIWTNVFQIHVRDAASTSSGHSAANVMRATSLNVTSASVPILTMRIFGWKLSHVVFRNLT